MGTRMAGDSSNALARFTARHQVAPPGSSTSATVPSAPDRNRSVPPADSILIRCDASPMCPSASRRSATPSANPWPSSAIVSRIVSSDSCNPISTVRAPACLTTLVSSSRAAEYSISSVGPRRASSQPSASTRTVSRPRAAAVSARSCSAARRPALSSTDGCSWLTFERSSAVDSCSASSIRSYDSGSLWSRASSRSWRAARTYWSAPSCSSSASVRRAVVSTSASSVDRRPRSRISPAIVSTRDRCTHDSSTHRQAQRRQHPGAGDDRRPRLDVGVPGGDQRAEIGGDGRHRDRRADARVAAGWWRASGSRRTR